MEYTEKERRGSDMQKFAPQFDEETLKLFRVERTPESDQKIVAHLVKFFRKQAWGWAHWCTGCFNVVHAHALIGTKNLYVNQCSQHGGRYSLIDEVRDTLPDDCKDRAYMICMFLYDEVVAFYNDDKLDEEENDEADDNTFINIYEDA